MSVDWETPATDYLVAGALNAQQKSALGLCWSDFFDEAMDSAHSVEEWFVPLSEEKRALREAYTELLAFGLKQEDIPLIIQMVENPKFDLPGIDIFHGSTDLRTHDFIHILLGRGVMIKDEAFVIGFTMGSTNRVTTTEERLFSLVTQYFYPKGYRFTSEDLQVYRDAVRLAYVSDCQPLAEGEF